VSLAYFPLIEHRPLGHTGTQTHRQQGDLIRFITLKKLGGYTRVERQTARWYHKHPFHHHPHWQKSPLWATALLTKFYRIASGFHYFGFRDNFFYRARLSALHPTPNLEYQVPLFMSPRDRVAQLHPQAPGSLFVAFFRLTELLWKYSNPPPRGKSLYFFQNEESRLKKIYVGLWDHLALCLCLSFCFSVYSP
jgi:hypothetical protein